ncbi:tRNA (adenosine(37)-N6)-dimethylallyltransferase MiaA [Nitrosospira sp. NpAV]|uniref:tRNA (adenosine(37)-N6)-dimethylallyltransferase MiaA n=1 Tax=Nitrosospira sp. NpAV TaxID=58133 RepID=UPI0005A0510C|nr:tRNA (adenosine(37)-N6)-dimethylallyltransferase MiaA [Nitrosospira sp. NpAV]KIO49536.1 tRNA delta(2)-isopentenylpyrophosphate transferase [Nitrosospira sp. NpAV]
MTEQSCFPPFPPAIVLMGPTASGKSGIALEIAKHLPIEIISVDSAQVYRHMDIGTAKPDAQSMVAVPHHLINLIEPHERYSAAQFVNHALAAMREITGRGNIPLLAGGTMLYFRALLEGLSELPSADTRLRALIETRAEESGWPALHNELLRLDPVSAARIQPTDSQRIQRALEVYYLTDKPMSETLKKPRHLYLPYRVIRVALTPGNRQVLHQRIAQRFEKMLERGLIDEVRAIRDKFCLDDESPSMRCVGYRQVWMYLNNEISLDKMREMALAATRQLAKRQLTWLRPMQGIAKFDCLMENLPEHVWEYLRGTGLKTTLVS